MEQTQTYLNQFEKAATPTEKRFIAEEYQAFYNTLSTQDKLQADKTMSILWPEIHSEVAELERMSRLVQQHVEKKQVTF